MHEVWSWRVNNSTVICCSFDVATKHQWLLVRLSWQCENCKLFDDALLHDLDETFSNKLDWNVIVNTLETCMEPHKPFGNMLYCLQAIHIQLWLFSVDITGSLLLPEIQVTNFWKFIIAAYRFTWSHTHWIICSYSDNPFYSAQKSLNRNLWISILARLYLIKLGHMQVSSSRLLLRSMSTALVLYYWPLRTLIITCMITHKRYDIKTWPRKLFQYYSWTLVHYSFLVY